jgi:hypothetical protein
VRGSGGLVVRVLSVRKLAIQTEDLAIQRDARAPASPRSAADFSDTIGVCRTFWMIDAREIGARPARCSGLSAASRSAEALQLDAAHPMERSDRPAIVGASSID